MIAIGIGIIGGILQGIKMLSPSDVSYTTK